MPRPSDLDLPPLDSFDESLGGASMGDWARLLLGAARRRWLVVIATFALVMAAVVLYYRSQKPLYRVEASILVKQTAIRPTSQDDAPTRSALEIIKSRSNLMSLLEQAGVAAAPGEAGTPSLLDRASQVANDLLGTPAGPKVPNDPKAALVQRLDKALVVTAGEGVITIQLDWRAPQQAYRLVQAAQQNFIEARQVAELTALDEVISTLQGRVATLRSNVDRVTEEVQRSYLREPSRPEPSGTEAATSAAPSTEGAEVSEELVRLRSMLEAKERALADVEEFRRRRLADLHAQLDEKRAVYSESYPAVVSLKQDIEALGRESPQVVTLRADAKRLRDQYEALAARTPSRTVRRSLATVLARRDPPGVLSAQIDQNERVRDARLQYQQMLDRLTTMQVELDSARTAFKHRYDVIWPAEIPRTPFSPKPRKIFGLGLIAALGLALAAAAAPDVLGGRVIQRWQVERTLDLPILAELNRP